MLFIIISFLLVSCRENGNDKAAALLMKIEQLYAEGRYCRTLDSITVLRERYPKAIEQRKRALKIWQEASLKMAQNDVMKTDSTLQLTLKQLNGGGSLLMKNKLRWKCDSLKGRYDAMCGVVRMIRKRMAEK